MSYCESCGQVRGGESRFCTNCGHAHGLTGSGSFDAVDTVASHLADAPASADPYARDSGDVSTELASSLEESSLSRVGPVPVFQAQAPHGESSHATEASREFPEPFATVAGAGRRSSARLPVILGITVLALAVCFGAAWLVTRTFVDDVRSATTARQLVCGSSSTSCPNGFFADYGTASELEVRLNKMSCNSFRPDAILVAGDTWFAMTFNPSTAASLVDLGGNQLCV